MTCPARGYGRGKSLFFQDTLQIGGVQQVHGLETSVVEHRVVVEDTGQGFGLLQSVHFDQDEGDALGLAVFPDRLEALPDVGALGVIVEWSAAPPRSSPFSRSLRTWGRSRRKRGPGAGIPEGWHPPPGTRIARRRTGRTTRTSASPPPAYRPRICPGPWRQPDSAP